MTDFAIEAELVRQRARSCLPTDFPRDSLWWATHAVLFGCGIAVSSVTYDYAIGGDLAIEFLDRRPRHVRSRREAWMLDCMDIISELLDGSGTEQKIRASLKASLCFLAVAMRAQVEVKLSDYEFKNNNFLAPRDPVFSVDGRVIDQKFIEHISAAMRPHEFFEWVMGESPAGVLDPAQEVERLRLGLQRLEAR